MTPSVADGFFRLGSVFLGPSYVSGSVTLTGTDASLVRADHISGNNEITLNLLSAANHKTKTSYSFKIVLDNTHELSITCNVDGTTKPIMQANTSMTIANGSYGAIANGTVTTDEMVASCTFAFDNSGSSDNSKFTLTSSGTLTLNERSAYAEKSSYSVKIKATSSYTGLTSDAATYSVAVQDGAPLFLQTSSSTSPIQSSNLTFSVVDDSNVLLSTSPSNSNADIYVSDTCTFSLGGTDAAKFTISPSSGTKSKVATLALVSTTRKQDQGTYSLTIIASNGTTSTSAKTISVTVGTDAIAPILTGSASSGINSYTIATGTNSTSNRDIIDLNSPWLNSDNLCQMLADEAVTFSLAGANQSLFELTSNTPAIVTDRPNACKCNLRFKASLDKYVDSTGYQVAIVATDPAGNSTTKFLNVVVHDVTKPEISRTISGAFINASSINYTNQKEINITYTADEDLSKSFVLSDFSVSGPASIEISVADSPNDKKTATLTVTVDDSHENEDITVTLTAGKVKDAHNNNILNLADTFTFRYKNNLSSLYTLALVGISSISIPRGLPYTDAGYTCNADGVIVNTSSTVDVKTLSNNYTVTYTATIGGITYTATRTVRVVSAGQRAKPVITVTGGSTSVVRNTLLNTWVDDATITPIFKSNGTTQIPVSISLNSVDPRKYGTYAITYSATDVDDVYGAIVPVTRYVSVVAVLGSVNFVLGGLNQEFTLSAALDLNPFTGPATEDDYNTLPGMIIDVPVANWNSLFYLKPSEPQLEKMTTNLVDIEIFEEDNMHYKINENNFQNIQDMDTRLITENRVSRKVDHDNGIADSEQSPVSQTISAITLRNAVYDMFNNENFEYVFSSSSKNAMLSEVDNIFKTSGTFNSQIKAKLTANNDKNNFADKSRTNLGRQLVLQLHKAIAPNNVGGDFAYRLTGASTADSIFNSSNKVTAVGSPYKDYYPFLFKVGDTLQFTAKLSHPNRNVYMTNGVVNQPKPMTYLFKLNMVETV
jgi:hypothetical protein